MKQNSYKFVKVEILTDESPANPRDEFDNLSTFYGPKNSRYSIGGKNDREIYREDLPGYLEEFKRERAVIVPFSSNAGECYAVITRAEVIKEYGNDSRSSLYRARSCARAEISEWIAYINGEVYGYEITGPDGESLDSCWGFYGESDCEEEANTQAKYFESEFQKNEDLINARLKI